MPKNKNTRLTLSSAQRAMLERIAATDMGASCTAATLTLAEHSGRGHSASYARVTRLRRRGLITRTQVGNRYELSITDRGRAALGTAPDQVDGIDADGDCNDGAHRG